MLFFPGFQISNAQHRVWVLPGSKVGRTFYKHAGAKTVSIMTFSVTLKTPQTISSVIVLGVIMLSVVKNVTM